MIRKISTCISKTLHICSFRQTPKVLATAVDGGISCNACSQVYQEQKTVTIDWCIKHSLFFHVSSILNITKLWSISKEQNLGRHSLTKLFQIFGTVDKCCTFIETFQQKNPHCFYAISKCEIQLKKPALLTLWSWIRGWTKGP